jgi:hypothetical protein
VLDNAPDSSDANRSISTNVMLGLIRIRAEIVAANCLAPFVIQFDSRGRGNAGLRL